ncbi:DnaJ-domain-containing protein [Byssothecium circinans]|uniref:DnaJ-domain-containing protein n=1 Tax=Byssothecium circinans TaxID=147558 RepID=A0A6A5U043_9PLEO|nr:DnaJ-domain-containing protein [Byssothecium circinans]
MESMLPPDPYKALGLPKDADQALIKSTYRKLVLKCHPDKVTDETLKAQKREEFHKIQQAYEVIGEEDKRERYDREAHLEMLRREKAARNGGAPTVEVRTARYETRTQAPAGATFSSTGAHRYEEHKPSSRSYDDRYDRYSEERSRKYDTYEAYPKHSSPRTSREKEVPIKVTRVSADRTRSDPKKSRDKEERRDRRYVSAESESSADEKARYEAEYRRRSEDARKERDAEDIRRAAADARRKAEERRSYDDKYDRADRSRKLSEMENDAVRYIHRSKIEAERPSPSRTTSSRDVRPEYYSESRSRRDPRRSSARPEKRSSASSGRDRDRKDIQIVDWDSDDRRIPSFKQSTSSPADIHVPSRGAPQRSYTESSHRREVSPPPAFRRSETMPAHSSSRRKEPTPSRPSGLRESVTPHDSGASSPESFPTVPPPMTTKYYTYTTPGGGVRLTPEDANVANGHRTVTREPAKTTPSPLSRPPMGPNRPVEVTPTYTTAAPKVSMVPPPLGRSQTMNVSPSRGTEDRGRQRPLYREIGAESSRQENARRQTSFSPEKVSYAQKIGPEDIRWSAPRGRDTVGRDREYAKPTLGRHATSVY